MSSMEVVIPSKCCTKWGPEQRAEELMESVTNPEYQKMRDIMHGYRINGLGAAAGIAGVLVTVLMINAIVNDSYATLGQTWCIGIPWPLCISIAMSRAKAKVNAEILNPKGMNLQCYGCFAHKIVLLQPSLGSVGDAARVGVVGEIETQSEFEEKSQSGYVAGKRAREGAPSNYGTVELTHSSKSDVGEDVLRSMYTHISDGVTRSERIISCNMKIVYVPEEDLVDLAQVYNSHQMGELRVKSKSEDGARRVLRFFYNNGSSLQVAADSK